MDKTDDFIAKMWTEPKINELIQISDKLIEYGGEALRLSFTAIMVTKETISKSLNSVQTEGATAGETKQD